MPSPQLEPIVIPTIVQQTSTIKHVSKREDIIPAQTGHFFIGDLHISIQYQHLMPDMYPGLYEIMFVKCESLEQRKILSEKYPENPTQYLNINRLEEMLEEVLKITCVI